MTPITLSPTEEAYQLIDTTLDELKGVTIAEASRVSDLLLDLRILIAKMEAGS
jgi:hypothetical protein